MVSDIIQQSFSINLRVLRAFYMYPDKQYTLLNKIKAHVMYLLCATTVPLLSITHLLLEENLEVERVNDNALFLIQMTCFMIKILPFIRKSQRIKRCVDFFETNSLREVRDEHRFILAQCIKTCRRISAIFFVVITGGVCSWASKPMFLKNRYFPADVWLPFNAIDDFYRYCTIYLLMVTGVFISAFATGVIDPLLAGLAYHATSQLKILNNNMKHLYKYAKEDSSSVTKKHKTINDFIYERIIQSVRHHNTILNFVKEYEECFSWVLFSQLGASVFTLCFIYLQISKIKSVDFNFFQMVLYIPVILGQIYFYCYYGSTLSEESDGITNAIYMSNWYNYDTKCKKALKLFMESSKKPLIVTVGKLVDLSLITFAMILRRSYSLLAVLKNYQ